jgi:hypothetical protein
MEGLALGQGVADNKETLVDQAAMDQMVYTILQRSAVSLMAIRHLSH